MTQGTDTMTQDTDTKMIQVGFRIPADVDMTSEDHQNLKQIILHAVWFFKEHKGWYDHEDDLKVVDAILHES